MFEKDVYEAGRKRGLEEAAELCRAHAEWARSERVAHMMRDLSWPTSFVADLCDEMADNILADERWGPGVGVCTTVHPDPKSGEKPEPNGANRNDRADESEGGE